MCPMERRPNERAMHESFLVIKAAPTDMGSRPIIGPFATPDLTVGPDGRPRALVWNLGTREVQGVVTEFATVPAGMPIKPENRKIIGLGNPANIPANSCVAVSCQAIWPRMSSADLLFVTAYHPDLDPVKAPYDPILDRHCGQMIYAWTGRFEGKIAGAQFNCKVGVEIKPANRGLYRVRIFLATEGRLPTNPQVDRIMAPNGHSFRWLEHGTNKKDMWDLIMQDNLRMIIRCKTTLIDSIQDVAGAVERV
jgi:hypothetical protein